MAYPPPPHDEGDDSVHDLDSTQPTLPQTRPLPPPPSGPHVRPLPGREGRSARKRRGRRSERAERVQQQDDEPLPPRKLKRPPRDRSDSGLYLPAWSVILMLVTVLGIAGFVILLVWWLGSDNAPGGEPRVIIVTAVASNTPSNAEPGALQVTLPAGSSDPEAIPEFALEGEIPPTVALTPTPVRLDIGQTVRIVNVGASRLNFRSEPGRSSQVLFQANEGDTFFVLDGPRTSDGLTWWYMRRSEDTSQAGWAVENDGQQDVLEVVPQVDS